MKRVIVLLASALLSAPAVAADPAVSPPAAAGLNSGSTTTPPPSDSATSAASAPAVVATATGGKAVRDPNRMICKSEEVSGSLIAKRKVCLTARDWKEQAFRAGSWTDRQQTMNSPVPGGR